METATAEELTEKFKRYAAVVSCSGASFKDGTQTKIAEAVIAAGVGLYVPWEFGPEYEEVGKDAAHGISAESLTIREILKAQTQTKHLIFSVGLFMSWLFSQAFGVVDLDKNSIRALGSWDNKITLAAPQDIGRVVADVLLDTAGLENQILHVAGETLSWSEIGDVVEEYFGCKFELDLISFNQLSKRLEGNGEEEPVDERETSRRRYQMMFAGPGVAWEVERTVNHKRRIDMMDLREYLESTYAD